ncbi:Uncharacterised protein [Mycobacteroides abscessus subsp. abscessus]|nr:Uncharacterised protein [Mycobacteroides abscessus subsp. abscessus]
MEASPYRAATRVMIELPPPRCQKTSAALSSEDCSIRSKAARSAGVRVTSPCDSRMSRSSAMKSFATDAMAMVLLLPLDTTAPDARSLITAVSVAPALLA